MARSQWRTTVEWATESGSYAVIPRCNGFSLKSGNGQVIASALAASPGQNDVVIPTGGAPSLTGLSFQAKHVASGGLMQYFYRTATNSLTTVKFRINNPDASWELFGAYNSQHSLRWAPDNEGSIQITADFIGTNLYTTSCTTASAEAAGAIYQWYDGSILLNSTSYDIVEAGYTVNHNLIPLFNLNGATNTFPNSIHTDTLDTIEGSITGRQSTTSIVQPGTLTRSVFNVSMHAIRAGATTTSYQWLFMTASMTDPDVINHGGPSSDPMTFTMPFIVKHGGMTFSVV